MDWFIYGVALALMAAGPLLLIVAWAIRRGTVLAATAAVATTASAVWWFELCLVFSGAGDLDGSFDCYPSCSASQKGVAASLAYLPLLMAAVLVTLGLIALIRHVRHSTPTDVGRARATR